MPVTVKDLDLAGAPTTWGDPENRNIATSDSDPVARLRARSNCFWQDQRAAEFVEWQSFNDVYGTTKNPWDQTVRPGALRVDRPPQLQLV